MIKYIVIAHGVSTVFRMMVVMFLTRGGLLMRDLRGPVHRMAGSAGMDCSRLPDHRGNSRESGYGIVAPVILAGT